MWNPEEIALYWKCRESMPAGEAVAVVDEELNAREYEEIEAINYRCLQREFWTSTTDSPVYE